MAPTYRSSPAPDAELVALGPGLGVESPILLTCADHDGYAVEITVEAIPPEEDHPGRFEVAGIAVRRRPRGPEVTGEFLRRIPIARLVRSAGAKWWQTVTVGESEVAHADERLTDEIVARLKAAGPSDPETLTWTARLYRMALVFGDPPLLAVQEHLKLPRSTASSWIKAARDKGFLGRSEGRGRAGG